LWPNLLGYENAMITEPRPRPIVLCVLDGWGEREDAPDNAIARAGTPVWHRLMTDWPHARLSASAEDVGLPAGQMGNSEVGHMSLGAGRIVLQDLPRIDRAVADGSLARNPALSRLIDKVRGGSGVCHLMGLISPGGVHSHQEHIAVLARILSAAGLKVWLHAFLDGRDTPPSSAQGYLEQLKKALAGVANIAFGVVSGRYYAMDRDGRWERTKLAHDALTAAQAPQLPSPRSGVAESYAQGITDEFVKPFVVEGYPGMGRGDGLLCANFRADRVRQILRALLDPGFAEFERRKVVAFSGAAGLTDYGGGLAEILDILFPSEPLKGILGEVIAQAGLKQLRIAETEKYAHVTYFFNGGEERVFPGEERILVPSPKVATYDLKPEMSAEEVTDRVVAAIEGGRFDLIVLNYANPDMVGHTGNFAAALTAVETVDRALGRVLAAVEKRGGVLLITADHGNIERMRDEASAQPHTAHTSNRVPVVLAGLRDPALRLRDGGLSDVAPTILALMGLEQPCAMTGRSLLVEERVPHRAGAHAALG